MTIFHATSHQAIFSFSADTVNANFLHDFKNVIKCLDCVHYILCHNPSELLTRYESDKFVES